MAYRNATYVAFHAAGTSDPTASDIKYFNLLKAWHVRDESDFSFINSHQKTYAVRDSSSRETLRARLAERLRNSKNMLLILGATTRLDTDWVPFEIAYAIDTCKVPIIAAYPGYNAVRNPMALRSMWPSALATRINSQLAHVIHVPFKVGPLTHAVNTFSFASYPIGGGLGIYSNDAYSAWGLT
jgi:hypothetical protein